MAACNVLTEQPSDRRAMPSVNGNVRSFKRIALAAAYRVRRKEPFHALEVSGRCAVALIHVTTTDPFREGRHANLVAHVVIPNRSPDRMRAMTVIVARERRIIAAWISNAVVDCVMPVVIVIGSNSIPTAIVRLQRVMCPTLTSIRAPNRNSLPSEPQRPDIRRVRVIDVGSIVSGRCASDGPPAIAAGSGAILDLRIAFHSGHIGPRSQFFGDLATALDQNRVHNVKGAMLDAAFTQP